MFSTFGADSFSELENQISSMAPSMVGYYLSDMCAGCEESYINKRNIQDTIYCDEYNICLDYNDDIYLEYYKKHKTTTKLAPLVSFF